MMPHSGQSPETVFGNALPIAETPEQSCMERRGIHVDIADAAEVRFDPNFGGRHRRF
jgi:hypothetical protein